MRDIEFKAVLWGFGGFFIALIFGMIFGLFVPWGLHRVGVPANQYGLSKHIVNAFVAFACYVFSGYTTARFSKNKPMNNVVLLGVLNLVLGLSGNLPILAKYTTLSRDVPDWLTVIMYVSVVPGCMLGGKIWIEKNKQSNSDLKV